MTGLPTIADIRAAAHRLAPVVAPTPLLESPFLNRIAGRRVLVKAESLQRTGSFKFRGAWSRLTALTAAERTRGVIAFSSGNHAQGVAHAAELLSTPCTILMPADAPALKLANTRAYGAEVVTYDRAGGEDRDPIAARLSAMRGLTLVRPFEDRLVIAGQGTAGLELAAQARAAGVERADVLVCCGGGGLTAGIALALEAAAPGLRARPVEPEGFEDVALSLAAGRRLPSPRTAGSICDAIMTPISGEATFAAMRRLCGPGLVVAEAEAMAAVAAAFLRLKLVLEPGGAVALAAALFHPEAIEGEAVIAVGTGGNVEPAVFARAIAAGA